MGWHWGTQKTNLTAEDNIFISVQSGGEGIGLGEGVVVEGSPGDDTAYLEGQNVFEYDFENRVLDYRLEGKIDTTSSNPARLAKVESEVVKGYSVVVPLTFGSYEGAQVVISLFDESGNLLQAIR